MPKDELDKAVAPGNKERLTIQDNQQTDKPAEAQTDDGLPDTEDLPSPEAADKASQVTVAATKPPLAKRWWQWISRHKKLTIPGALLIVLVILAIIPFTRYHSAGLVLQQHFTVQVVDAQNHQPVSSAVIELAGRRAMTDGRGMADVQVPVGHATLAVSKKYFRSTSQKVLVPIARQKHAQQIALQATGRQVPVVISNKITKKPLSGVTVKALDTEAKTDNEGKAVLVIPAGKQTVEATINASGYNEAKQSLHVTEVGATNNIALTPAGKIYFLSNQNGTINVMKSNLDGSDKTVAVAGTGHENRTSTVLLAAQDWRYLALHAKRDSEKAKIYLIDTAGDQLTVMDEGDADFNPIGWSGNHFIYQVDRNIPVGQSRQQALKSFDATTHTLATLAETSAEGDRNGYGYVYEQFGSTYILDNEIVYTKNWYSGGWTYRFNYGLFNGKQATFNSVLPDGKAKKIIKGYDRLSQDTGISLVTRPYGPQEVYIYREMGNGKNTIEEYEQGTIKPATNVTQDDFYNKPYPTYLASPSEQKTLWSELRDGKNAFFLGDEDGDNEQQIGVLPEFTAYGWYTNDYVLLAKKGSELYVSPATNITADNLVKVTDYYRPDVRYEGYGRGYGGL